MSPETLLHCKDTGAEDNIKLAMSSVQEGIKRGHITPEVGRQKLEELQVDLDFIYDAFAVTRRPYRQVA